MNYKKREILLSIWISVSFVITIIGLMIIEYALLNYHRAEDKIFWQKFNQIGNILTLVAFISTFISLITTILMPHINKKNLSPLKIRELTLTKVFTITIVCVSVILAITNISLIIYMKNTIQLDFDKIMQLSIIQGAIGQVELNSMPIFAIIETILIFITMKKQKTEIKTITTNENDDTLKTEKYTKQEMNMLINEALDDIANGDKGMDGDVFFEQLKEKYIKD